MNRKKDSQVDSISIRTIDNSVKQQPRIERFSAYVVNAQIESLLLYKFPSISFESLLASNTAEIIRFFFMPDLEFGCLFVQNHAANRIPRHCFFLHRIQS